MPEPLERSGISHDQACAVALDLTRIVAVHRHVFRQHAQPITCSHGRCDGAAWSNWVEFAGHLGWVLVEPSTRSSQPG